MFAFIQELLLLVTLVTYSNAGLLFATQQAVPEGNYFSLNLRKK